MLSWLRRAPQRNIYTYHDGQRWRSADPFAAWNAIESHPSLNLEIHPVHAAHPIDDSDYSRKARTEAERIIAGAMRDVFAIPAWEAGGLGIEGCLDLFADFVTYMAAVKKKRSLSAT